MSDGAAQGGVPRDLVLIFAAAGVRSAATGPLGVVLGLHLAHLGMGPATLGLVIGSGLAGLAAGAIIVAFAGDRVGRRRTLLASTLVSAAGLALLAAVGGASAMAGAAFLGMVNGMGRDRGPAQVVEQSLLADLTAGASRTRAFARYALIQDLAGAAGTAVAVAPALLEATLGLSPQAAGRWTLLGLAALSATSLAIYARFPSDPPIRASGRPWWHVPLSHESRPRVTGLAALFALDSVGGGFLAGSIVTYWFFRRFGLEGDVLGPVFLIGRVLSATSYIAAEWLALRIGLLRTMVFTHLPSSAVLCALPLVGSPWIAIALFLARETLVQMDVPTRQAYIAAVTEPGERTFAMGVSGVVRNAGWAVGPPLAGVSMGLLGLGAPLLIGAGLKILYDVALFASFRRVHS